MKSCFHAAKYPIFFEAKIAAVETVEEFESLIIDISFHAERPKSGARSKYRVLFSSRTETPDGEIVVQSAPLPIDLNDTESGTRVRSPLGLDDGLYKTTLALAGREKTLGPGERKEQTAHYMVDFYYAVREGSIVLMDAHEWESRGGLYQALPESGLLQEIEKETLGEVLGSELDAFEG